MMKKKQTIPFRLQLLSWIPSLLSLVIVLAITIPLFLLVLPTGILLCKVEGTSMDTTLHDGQFMFQAGKDFSRGDIVICTIVDANGQESILIKRIVGIPGETVQINADGVYINGEKLREDYLTSDAVANTYREQLRNEVSLGEDAYFLMGDNRRVSYDSRYFGSVLREDLLYVVTDKPTAPFFVALVPVIALIIVVCWVEIRLDALFLRLFCKRFPALEEVIKAEKEGKENTGNTEDQRQ